MIFHKRIMLAWFALAWMTGMTDGKVQAQFWDPGYALLNSDTVMSGRIEQQGDTYKIKINEGNEVRIPQNQIKTIAGSLNELYQFKKRTLPQLARGGDHAQLARWCLKVNLLAEAGEHYLIFARNYPPKDHQSVKQLGEEIKDAMLQQNEFRVAMGLQPIHRNQSNTASASSVKSVVTASTANSSAIVGLNPELSHYALVKFTDQVQHILINRCGQAACHGYAGQSPFRLLELGGRDSATRSQTNLESVLRYVNKDPKAKSVLVEYMMKTHGSMHSPPIGNREIQLIQEVVNWVQFVQNPVVTADAVNQSSALNPLDPTAPQLRQVPKNSTGTGVVSAETRELPGQFVEPTIAELDALDAEIRHLSEPAQKSSGSIPGTQKTNAPAAGSSNDQFDPAEFNRQVGGRRN